MTRPLLLHRFPPGWRAISTAVTGGGIAPAGWWLNAQVTTDYHHPDPAADAAAIAREAGLEGPGVAMLTAADVTRFVVGDAAGVGVVATVGLGLPVFAAAAEEAAAVAAPIGTINVLVTCPVPLVDAALVNAVVTATEAKAQALAEAGVPGTGTASDALAVACPAVVGGGGVGADPEPYGGPRSVWGARIARAVHAAVAAGAVDWLARHPAGDPHRAGDWRTRTGS